MALIFYLVPLTSIVSPAKAATVIISGTVEDSDGNAMNNVEMWLYANSATNDRSTKYTDANGNFSYNTDDLTLSVGDYVSLEARTPTGYNALNDTQATWIWDGNTYADNPINPQFVLAPKTITGNVTFDPSGDPAAHVDVVAYPIGSIIVGTTGSRQVSANTDANGDYSMNLRSDAAAWNVQAVVNLSDHNTAWLPTGSPVSVAFTNDSSPESETLDFTVEATTASISATFLDADGDLLTSNNFQADCSIFRSEGIGTVRKVDTESKLVNIGLPPGTYRYWCFHNDFTGQSFVNNVFSLKPDEQKDLGTIQAQTDGATISGTLTNASTGNSVSGRQITLSSKEYPKFLTDDTDQHGRFTFTVGPGTWTIGLNQGGSADARLVTSKTIYIPSNSTKSKNNDIQIETLDAEINGAISLENSEESLEDFSGGVFVKTDSGEFLSAPVETGTYRIKLPLDMVGEKVVVGVAGDVNSNYVLPTSEEVTISRATHHNISLSENDATISGTVLNSSGNPINPSANQVTVIAVDDNGNIRKDSVATDGTYSLDVAKGDWSVTLRVEDDDSDYINPVSQNNLVNVKSGKNTTFNLSIKVKQGTVEGTVSDSSGEIMPLAPVMITNLPLLEAQEDYAAEDIVEVSTTANASGAYETMAPSGSYLVFAGNTPDLESDELMSDAKEVTVTANHEVTANLSFVAANATLNGTVKDADDNAVSSGNVAAYNEEGGFVETEINTSGEYSLALTSAHDWNLVASAIDGADLLTAKEEAVSIEAGSNSLDLGLTDSEINVPGSVSKSFDADEFVTLALPDGSNVQFSPYSIDSSGTVSVSIEPRIDLSPSLTGDPASIGYDINARNNSGVEVTKLNSPAKISLVYDETYLTENGISEDNLMPQFYSENEKFWSNQGMATMLNADENKTDIYTDHLTRFSVNGNATATVETPEEEGEAIPSLGIVMTPASAGGPNVRVVDENGEQISSFFAYDEDLRMGLQVEQADIDGDTVNEIVVTPGEGVESTIKAFELDGTEIATTLAFDEGFTGGVSLTCGDFNGDGKEDIAVTPTSAGGPNVRIYTLNSAGTGFTILDWFFAYDENFRGGTNLVAGDVTGDGTDELVVTPRSAGGPNVRIYHFNTTKLEFESVDWVMAYQEEYHGGVQVATGDINGDGKEDIIVSPYLDGGPNIRVYTLDDDNQLELLDWVMAYDSTYRGTLSMSVGDIDGDGQGEIVLAPKTLGGPNVRVYTYNSNKSDLELVDWFMAHDDNFRGGVNLFVNDVDGDDIAEVITSPASQGGPNVRVYDMDTGSESLKGWFWAFPEGFRGGVNFGK